MEIEPIEFVHIEFFYAEECPYCPTVRKMIDELINSKLGLQVIVEEIDINSPAGQERVKLYKKLKGVPAVAIDGTLKFMGVPHPTLLFNEVKKIAHKNKTPKRAKPKYTPPSKIPRKSDDELSFYT